MPIIDLNEVIFHHPAAGISCPVCAGDLQPAGEEGKMAEAWRLLLPLPLRKVLRRYRCSVCEKQFVLREE